MWLKQMRIEFNWLLLVITIIMIMINIIENLNHIHVGEE